MGRMMNQLAPRNAAGRFVLVEIDVGPLLKESTLVLLALCALLAVFFGIVILLLAYSRRISKYREREQDTAHLVQLGEAARTLAHEIKNPLGIIRVQCATLERTVPDERRKNIAVITEETERLALLADRVRDFLQTSGGVPVRCDAELFVSSCVERYGGRLSSGARNGLPASVFVDPGRMVQILDNLVSNALESGGEEPPVLSVTARRNQVIYQIADRGNGIESANRSRLFEPFFTTKTRGSGIGLALARRYAREAGGTIEYSPRSGGGSVFSVILPAFGGGSDHE
jgi:two-component system sensor histidine kinase HydH